MSDRKDFDTADEPDLGQDDDKPSHPIHRLHRLHHRFLEIGSELKRLAEQGNLDMLDFTSFDTAVSELKKETASIETNQADVAAKATADANTASQAELEAKVASDLTPSNIGFPAATPPPVAPTITSANPLDVPGGSAVSATVTVSAGTIAAGTSADGAFSMDATGAVTGQAGASGGTTTIPVVVTNADGSTTDLVQSIDFT